MGSRAKLRAAQRVSLKQQRTVIRRLHDEAMADPEYVAALDRAQDDEVQAIVARDREGQEDRLRLHRWRRVYDGTDGLGMWDLPSLRLVHAVSRERDGEVWSHLSVSRRDGSLPGWFEVRDVQWLIYPERTGLIVVAPGDEHVSVSEVSHIWTKLTGEPASPDFRKLGSL